jgi:hypothetical protein
MLRRARYIYCGPRVAVSLPLHPTDYQITLCTYIILFSLLYRDLSILVILLHIIPPHHA